MTESEKGEKSKKGHSAKGFSSRKWLPWLLAVLIAVLIWGQSLKGRLFRINIVLPVEVPEILSVEEEDRYVIYINSDTDSVTVTFEGAGMGVIKDQITHHPLRISWQETISTPGNDFPLSKIHILTVQDIEFSTDKYSRLEPVLFLPHSISYEIDRRISLSLPIHVPSTDSIPERYLWSYCSEDSVIVEGAASVIRELSCFSTEAVTPGTPSAVRGFSTSEGVEFYSPAKVYAGLRFPEPVVFFPDLETDILH